MSLAEAAKRGRMSVPTLRHLLLHTEIGPPAFKRPGSSRWLLWEKEFDGWLEKARQLRPID